eukprot:TRINITY_DN35133_c0_g1_i1.p1 TRINITY_DN35133_c0_g1~~TRINITY_DN35133_c0_g1_i1.p1  ORF type:complete len:276 (+),score=54.79 TRINITY_DN35133_c0_g1_i1:64-828(+)
MAPPYSESAKPVKVGPYYLGRTVGTGGYSKVKEGWNEEGERVAVKITKLGGEGEGPAREEVKVLEELGKDVGSHVIKLLDVMESSKYLYTVLELVEGCDLFEAIVEKRGLPDYEARWVFKGVLKALLHLHNKGVAHGDVKPENILVSFQEGVVKLADYGFAVSSCEATHPSGSPSYAAPEVLMTRPKFCPFKADIWSLGATLHVALTATPATPANVRASDSELVRYILQPNPRNRPSLRDILQHPWLCAVETEG